jgi:hypothetical protein
VQLKGILKEKHIVKFTKVVLILDDNAPAYRAQATQKKLSCLSFQYLDNPPYFPDLAPSDHRLFPGLKQTFGSWPLFFRRGGNAAAETWLDGRRIF